MDSDDEVVTRRNQQFDFGSAAMARPKKVPLNPVTAQSSATLALSAPGVVARPAAPTQVRPARFELCRRRQNHPIGRAPRRARNARTRGSRRSAGIRSGQDPGDPDLDPESPAGFRIPKLWIRQNRVTPVPSPTEVEVPA
jgi:hypothetical protein